MRSTYPTKLTNVVFVELRGNRVENNTTSMGRPRDQETSKRRLAFYELTFGKCRRVFPDPIPDRIPRVDILWLEASDSGGVIISSGMSDARMPVPEGSREATRLELLMYVDNLSDDILEKLVLRLRQSALFPFVENTYLGHGDTIHWMAPVAPGSELTSDLLLYSTVSEHRKLAFPIHGDDVELLWCIPITEEELQHKKQYGLGALLRIFDQESHPRSLNVFRHSYV